PNGRAGHPAGGERAFGSATDRDAGGGDPGRRGSSRRGPAGDRGGGPRPRAGRASRRNRIGRVSEWRQPHPTWIVGHRGAPKRARENTLDSLDWAETIGADAVEFDLRQTRDGEAVLFHDEDVVLGGQRVPVRSFTSREIERLQLPSEFGDYRIPRLEDAFHRSHPP